MATESLTVRPLSNNDIRVLAGLLKHQYKDHLAAKNPIEKRYVSNLIILVGLGFTAIMEDGAFTLPMQTHLNQFLIYFDLLQKEDAFSMESLAAAHIISLAAYLFHRLRYPEYYTIFKKILKEILESGFVDSAKRRGEASRLMHLMLTQ